MADLLHQFEIKPIGDLPDIGSFGIDFTNSSLFMMLAAILPLFAFYYAMRKKSLVPGKLQISAELFYRFVFKMVTETMGAEGRRYFPFVMSVFLIVLMGNLLGMIPTFFTFTSHLSATATLAVMVFATVLIMGFARHGLKFLSIFVPSGVPAWLLPLIVPIEVLSFFSRPITLAMRLFINMFAGHLLLKVVAGFSVSLFSVGVAGMIGSIIPAGFNVIMTGFELFVAVIQAYVFALLTCIYLKDTLEIHH